MRKTALLRVAITLALAGCADAGYDGGDDLGYDEAPGDDKADGQDALLESLRQKYGVRPRRYNGLLDESNEAEAQFRRLLPQAAGFLNTRARELGRGFDVHEAELALNFITEGGFYVLDQDRTTGISGFGDLGIDTLVDNYAALAPWLHPVVRAAVESGTRTVTRVNERGEEVHTLTDLTLEDGVYANAGMYAWAKSIAAGDLADRGAAVEDLPAPGEYFWATVYFNAGPGTGRKLLDQHGARYFERKWTGPDDPCSCSGPA